MPRVAPPLVREYYRDCVGRAFDDLALPADASLAAYLGDVLVRYAFRIDVRPATIAAYLVEIQRCWHLAGTGFDPGREVPLRRDLGDAALFLTGYLWERVVSRRARRHLIRMGRNAYGFLAEYHRAAAHPEDALLFGRLSRRFVRCGVLLMYVREVYVEVDRDRPIRTAGPR